jgi:hypothetical protein
MVHEKARNAALISDKRQQLKMKNHFFFAVVVIF